MTAVAADTAAPAWPRRSSRASIAAATQTTQQAGTSIHIETAEGDAVPTFEPAKPFASIVLWSPDLVAGTTLDVYLGGEATGDEVGGRFAPDADDPGTLAGSLAAGRRPGLPPGRALLPISTARPGRHRPRVGDGCPRRRRWLRRRWEGMPVTRPNRRGRPAATRTAGRVLIAAGIGVWLVFVAVWALGGHPDAGRFLPFHLAGVIPGAILSRWPRRADGGYEAA